MEYLNSLAVIIAAICTAIVTIARVLGRYLDKKAALQSAEHTAQRVNDIADQVVAATEQWATNTAKTEGGKPTSAAKLDHALEMAADIVPDARESLLETAIEAAVNKRNIPVEIGLDALGNLLNAAHEKGWKKVQFPKDVLGF